MARRNEVDRKADLSVFVGIIYFPLFDILVQSEVVRNIWTSRIDLSKLPFERISLPLLLL